MLSRPVDGEQVGPEKGRDPRLQRESHQERIELSTLLAKHGIRPDKRFGQHFLVSSKVIRQIVSRVEGVAGVLEVGPGPGVLTRPLCESGTVVTVVELDQVILPVLRENAPHATIIEDDALKVDLIALIEALPQPRAVVSNMPYNITGPLLDRFTTLRSKYVKAVLMMQREVAEKILAQPGDSRRGALSVVMQALFEIKRVCNAPPGAFLPPPKVESTVLEFTPIPTSESDAEMDRRIEIVRAGFSQPRKTLLNNLSSFGRAQAEVMLTKGGVDPQLRPHQLTWEQWKKLTL